MKSKLENLCVITTTGVCHIHYLISLHLPMIFFLIKQDKCAICSIISSTERMSNALFSEGSIIWNVIPTFIFKNASNINSLTLSLKANVAGLAHFREKLVLDRAVGITRYLPVITGKSGKYVGITL